MGRALAITGVVAFYTLVETLLLASTMFYGEVAPSSYQYVVWFSQLVLIPGLAALYSFFFFGRKHIWRRSLFIITFGAALVPAFTLPFVLWGFVLEFFKVTNGAVIVGVFVFTLILTTLCAVRLTRFMRTRARKLEVESWLESRQVRNLNSRKWHVRGITASLWCPSLVVLFVFLFFPEAWGLLSHVVKHAAVLRGYRVPVPATWLKMGSYSEENGASNVYGLVGTSALRTTGYSLFRFPLSSWSISIEPRNVDNAQTKPWLPATGQVVRKRSLLSAGAVMACYEYVRGVYGTPKPHSQTAFVTCVADDGDRLRAQFEGNRIHLESFYDMVQSIQKSETNRHDN